MPLGEDILLETREYLDFHTTASKAELVEYLASRDFSKLQIMWVIQKNFDISILESKRIVLETLTCKLELSNLHKTLELAAEANFRTVFAYYDWKPISNCPGRYVLKGDMENLTPLDLVGDGYESQNFVSVSAIDPISVISFPDGGLISYRKPDGTYVHTLGNREGFRRKLTQLGIQLKETP